MAMDIQGDQKVIVYEGGELEYEGLWADRPEEYDRDFYLLADVEQPDIVVLFFASGYPSSDPSTWMSSRSAVGFSATLAMMMR